MAPAEGDAPGRAPTGLAASGLAACNGNFSDLPLDALGHVQELVEEGMSKDIADAPVSEEEDFTELLKDPSIFPKIKLIVELSTPVIASYSLYQVTGFVILYYAGHLSSKAGDPTIFAGISMANMFANVSCFSILIGMTSAVETLASQNNGAKNYREVGLLLQRSVFVLSLMLLPIAVMWIYAEDIFLALGTDRGVCIVMGKYLRIRMATMPVDVISKSYEKYLCCLGITKPALYAQIGAIICMLFFGGIFIHKFDWGYESLAVAFVISTYLSFLFLFGSSYFHPAVQRTLQPLSIDALNNLKEFVVLGFPGLAMLCSEWWAYEALTLFASQLGPEAVAAQTIIVQVASLAYMVPLGVGITATTLVGNTIGSGDIDIAKQVAKLSVWCCVVCELMVSALIIFGANSFIGLFSDDSLVLSISRRTIPILAVMTWMDGMSAVLGGIMRGAGQQHIGAYANIPSFYLVALPLAWFLCFKTSFGVVGLVLGIAIGPLIVDICLFFLIFFKSDYIFKNAKPVYEPVSTDSVDISEEGTKSVELSAMDSVNSFDV
jgi:MATE family multidrug resistance protein